MTTDLVDHLRRHVARGTIPGAVGLTDRGGDVRTVAVGDASIGGPAMQTDAVFRIQSMTKAVTTVAALRMVREGFIALDDSVEPWLPELADRRVLASPESPLTDTVPARHPITLRHLLTNTSGYGGIVVDSPLQRAMVDAGVDAGPEPVALGAGAWLERLSRLPLAFQPGTGWRYHHSFGILGILLSRIAGRPLGDHLRDDLFEPLGMVDTGFWASPDAAPRLPAAYRRVGGELVEVDPAGGGFYAAPPPFDVSHAELVSTASDYHLFLRALVDGDLIDRAHFASMVTDQVPAEAKTPESFFPGFWDGTGWGYGAAVVTAGEHRGRWGWSGGLGTDFFVDPDGSIAIMLTQVEIDGPMMALMGEIQDVL